MNGGQQILIRKRFVRGASEKFLAGIGSFELQFGQMQLQRTEMARVQRGLQQAFAFGEILKNGAGLILPAAAPDRGADNAHQRGRMERTFDESDVTQDLSEP